MSNFEYIIASLPYLTPDHQYKDGEGFENVIEEIKENLSEKDTRTLDVLLEGFDPEKLNLDFYVNALSSKNRFLREYFRFDLNLRNAKVRYLNERLGRDESQDVLQDEERLFPGEFDEAPKAAAIFEGGDLMTREKGLDDLTWNKIESLSVFHYFDITAVLGYVAKLHIADRWLSLDKEHGRELFRKLVDQIRGTFKGVKSLEIK